MSELADTEFIAVDELSISTVELDDGSFVVVEEGDSEFIDVTDTETVTVIESETSVLVEALQGPPGINALERILKVDYSRPVAYVGYASRILRLDYSGLPPVIASAVVASLPEAWPNRASLPYAAL